MVSIQIFIDIILPAIHTVKYADELVLLPKDEKLLQKMIDKLIEIGGCLSQMAQVAGSFSLEAMKLCCRKAYVRSDLTIAMRIPPPFPVCPWIQFAFRYDWALKNHARTDVI
jgi:hypothetical protein